MPNIAFYVDENDLKGLIGLWNADEEIAFLLTDGPGRWIAKKRVSALADDRYLLWHHIAGPLMQPSRSAAPILPSLESLASGTFRQEFFRVQEIANPWAGWVEEKPGGDPRVPWLGDPPHLFQLLLKTRSSDGQGLGLPQMSWIGNHYRVLGSGAAPITEKWWKRFRATIKKSAVPIRRYEKLNVRGNHQVWAFPSALERIHGGCMREEDSL